MNAVSLDVPYGLSEWALSGLRPAKSSTVKPDRVTDAVFSIEGKVMEVKELTYNGKTGGSIAIFEAKRFWVREDALNKEQDGVNMEVSRPLVALGGISYGRIRETFELPRSSVARELEKGGTGLERFLDN